MTDNERALLVATTLGLSAVTRHLRRQASSAEEFIRDLDSIEKKMTEEGQVP